MCLWSKWVSDRSERRVPSQRRCDMNTRWNDPKSKRVLANTCLDSLEERDLLWGFWNNNITLFLFLMLLNFKAHTMYLRSRLASIPAHNTGVYLTYSVFLDKGKGFQVLKFPEGISSDRDVLAWALDNSHRPSRLRHTKKTQFFLYSYICILAKTFYFFNPFKFVGLMIPIEGSDSSCTLTMTRYSDELTHAIL